MKNFRAFLSGILLIFSCTAVFAAELNQRVIYKLDAGDKLQISVFNQQELSGEYTLNGSGRFSMPFIGKIEARGLTVAELETLLIEKLKPDYLLNPRISIEVLNYRPFYIIGEVKSPDSYPYVDGMTYLNAVAIAGGFTYRAKEKYAMVRHNSKDAETEEVKVDMHMKVIPGDVIRIVERLF